MTWLERCLPLVIRFEGFRADRYIDAVGVPTIGYGETRPDIVARGHITEPAARRLLGERLREFGAGVDRAVTVPLTPTQKAALTSFAYNVGLGALADSTLRRLLNQGNYRAVPGQLLRWTQGGGRTLAGLVTRRRAEAELWARGRPSPLTRVELRLLKAARTPSNTRLLAAHVHRLTVLGRRRGWNKHQLGARRKTLARALKRRQR